jgi:predicted nucleotidyltransferase
MYKNALDVRKRVNEHYSETKKMGYDVVGVFLQGSQNYGVAYEDSDVDTKAILLPTFNDFVLKKSPISTTHICENNEHIDLKDVRVMFDCFKKQNINFIEILFTKYKVINPEYVKIVAPLFDNRELIASYNNYATINSLYGMALQKYKAMEHPYPTLLDKIEKFGYDPKQLHHIIRLLYFTQSYVKGYSYEECLNTRKKDYLIEVKRGCYNLEKAREIAEFATNEIYSLKEKYMETHPLVVKKEAEEVLDSVLVNLLRHSFERTLKES